MKIVTIDRFKPDSRLIQEAVTVMLSGGIVIHPSDTSYGLAVDSTNQDALKRLAQLKMWDKNRPPSVVIRDLEYLTRIALLTDRTRAILADYLPGPYTFVLINLDLRILHHPTIGIRMPDLPLLDQLADLMPVPYTTTSANLTGEPPAYSLSELEDGLLNPETASIIPDLMLDAGPLPKQPASTVVDLTRWPPSILRQGGSEFSWEKYVSIREISNKTLHDQRPIGKKSDLNYTG